jgi:hypothetical protein
MVGWVEALRTPSENPQGNPTKPRPGWVSLRQAPSGLRSSTQPTNFKFFELNRAVLNLVVFFNAHLLIKILTTSINKQVERKIKNNPLITHYSLLITHYSLLITHYSLLITHYSLLITHYSLLITHY